MVVSNRPLPPCLDAIAAAGVLRAGGIIAYPTEAVWGLGCDPFDEAAVQRLLLAKQREQAKGLILVGASFAQFDGLLAWDALPQSRQAAVLASWPGPQTWIVPAAPRMPEWIRGAHAGVAIRVSAHPGVVALCEAFGGPLVSTSANVASQPPPTSAEDIAAALLARLDAWMAGPTGGLARPTMIRDAASGDVLRG